MTAELLLRTDPDHLSAQHAHSLLITDCSEMKE